MRRGKQLIIIDNQDENLKEEKENKKIDQNYIKQDENYSSNKQESNSSDDEEDSEESLKLNYNHIKDDEEDLEESLKLNYNNIKDDEDDGVPNEKGIIQNGPSRGRKDHTENSPYAEDCFLLDLTESSNIKQYNPDRYSAFGCLSSVASKVDSLAIYKSLENYKKSREIRKKLLKIIKSIPGYLGKDKIILKLFKALNEKEKIDFQIQEDYQNDEIYKKLIDDWIEKVKKSPAKATKVVIDAHSDSDRILKMLEPYSYKKINKNKNFDYEGDVVLYDDSIINCLQYLFNRLKEINKNINVVNTACYAGEYLNEEKNKSIIDLMRETAEETVEKNKKFIYTCNYSQNSVATKKPNFEPDSKSLHKYMIYDKKKKDFISLTPELKEDCATKYAEYLDKEEIDTSLESKIFYQKIKEDDLQQAMAYKLYLQEKLKNFGDTEEEKNWAEETIDILESAKDRQSIIGVMQTINEFSSKENQNGDKMFRKFAQQNPLFFRDDGIMPNGVKKYHRRKRSYELFFDNETVDKMKDAKEIKNELLFELKPNIGRITLNNEHSLTNGWHDKDEDEEKIKKESKINLKELNGIYYFSDL